MSKETDLDLCGDLIVHDYESGVAVPRGLGSELERWAAQQNSTTYHKRAIAVPSGVSLTKSIGGGLERQSEPKLVEVSGVLANKIGDGNGSPKCSTARSPQRLRSNHALRGCS